MGRAVDRDGLAGGSLGGEQTEFADGKFAFEQDLDHRPPDDAGGADDRDGEGLACHVAHGSAVTVAGRARWRVYQRASALPAVGREPPTAVRSMTVADARPARLASLGRQPRTRIGSSRRHSAQPSRRSSKNGLHDATRSRLLRRNAHPARMDRLASRAARWTSRRPERQPRRRSIQRSGWTSGPNP